jgi:hypothetical protein
MRARGRAGFNCYRRGNHVACGASVAPSGRALAAKILDKYKSLKFDEKSRRIRVDFGQNPRFIANDSFNAVC